MEDESNSWVRRTKYSHTVWHRLDNSKIRAIPIGLQSVRDVAGQKTGTSSLPSSVGISDWRKTKSLQNFNEQESKSKEITGPTLSYFLSRSFDSNTVGPVPSSGSKEHNGGSEPVQRDKTPPRATVVAHASPPDLNSERPVSSLNSKGQSLKPKQRSKSPLPAKLIAEANPSDFDFQRPTLLFNPNVHSSKHKRRDLSPLPSTTNNYHKSFTFDTKFSQKNHRNLSPPPAKYFGSRNISSTSNREEPRPKAMNRALSPLPSSTPLSEEFKLARSNTKRFSTPVPSRKEEDAHVFAKVIPRESSNRGLFATPLSLKFNMFQNRSPLRATDKTKAQKENTWARYFDPSMVKVSSVDAVEECRIDLSELYLGLRFAIGANSRLYHGIYKSQSVAVKIITLPDDDEEDLGMRERLEKQFTGEVTFLSHLHHPNVIKLVGASRNPPVLCILTEYLSGGSLRAFLHKVEKKSLPLQKLIAIALDIARGMEYVHSKGVIHRDLKPENILLDQDLCVKIADFGIACDEAYCYALAEDPGTYRFMAPEMLSKERNYGRKVDVYSFGLILWEMLTGRIPYEDMIPYQAAFAVVDKNLRPPIPSDCPLPLRALIEQCWTLQPEKRPDFWQIVKVLEQFESDLASNGTLNLIPNLSNHEHHKRLHNWIQKLKQPSHNNVSGQTTPKLF